MNFSHEINSFIDKYVEAISNENASLFIGSGLSTAVGYPSWSQLLEDKAVDIGLDIKHESNNLISLAQYYVNKKQRGELEKEIRIRFKDTKDKKLSEIHKILASLPIRNWWTTNFDKLIEKEFSNDGILYSTFNSDKSLRLGGEKVQVLLHKMHGDIDDVDNVVITRRDYERYRETHEMLLAKFQGEMCSKTFLFLGYSFSDPDVNHILARMTNVYKSGARNHYCIMKRVDRTDASREGLPLNYLKSRQECAINDFEKYGINVLLVNKYEEIKTIVLAIRDRFFKKNVFIAGALEYNTENKTEIQSLALNVSEWLVKNGFRIYSGFGKNFGSFVVEGAFKGCSNANREFEDSIKLYPFPYDSKMKYEERKKLYTELRKRMISKTRITLVICGEKLDDENNIVLSPGIMEEVNISLEQGNIIIPVYSTGGIAVEIWNKVSQIRGKGYDIELFNKLKSSRNIYDTVIKIFKEIE